MLTECSGMVRMSNAILPQSLHQDIRVELLYVVDSNTEALSTHHSSYLTLHSANHIT